MIAGICNIWLLNHRCFAKIESHSITLIFSVLVSFSSKGSGASILILGTMTRGMRRPVVRMAAVAECK